jgi:flagellar biosynthesis/type III secretory pathway protein FliH
MATSSTSPRRVLRDIEVRDILSLHEQGRRSYTDEDLDEAYRRGVADARDAMILEREDAVRGVATALRDSGAALAGALDALRSHYRERVVDDAFMFAGWLLCREITADPAIMRARVDEALVGIEDDSAVVTVAPGMVELVEKWLPAATIRADATMRPGEVRVSSSSTTIDGTFADALQRLRAAFDADASGEAAR